MRISTTCLNTEILKARIFHRLNIVHTLYYVLTQ